MRRLILVLPILMLLAVAFTCGCSRGASASRELAAVDSLLQSDPDSAYALLCDADTTRLRKDVDMPLYHLLMAEGRYKTYHDDTVSDGLTRAVEYFRENGPACYAKRSLFQKGITDRNAGNHVAALLSLEEASEYADTVADPFFHATVNYEMSVIFNEVGDGPQQEHYARRALKLYEKADSTVFVMQAKLWLGASLCANGRIEEGMVQYRDVYRMSLKNKDRDIEIYALSAMAKACLMAKSCEEGKRWSDKLIERYKHEPVPLEDLDVRLMLLLVGGFSKDSVEMEAHLIRELYGNDALCAEYYEHKGDFERAYEARSDEYEGFAGMYLNGIRTAPHMALRAVLDEKREEVRRELELTRQRDFWIFCFGGVLVVCIGIVGWWIYDRKCRENSELLMRIGILVSQEVKTDGACDVGSSALLCSFIKNLGLIYSDYYEQGGCKPSEVGITDPSDFLDRLRSGIKTMTEDEKFLASLESEVDKATGHLLGDVYESIRGDLNESQRRIVVYRYFGLSTKGLCAVMNIKRDVFYNRKSRLLKTIARSTSPRRQELLDILAS